MCDAIEVFIKQSKADEWYKLSLTHGIELNA